MKKKILFISESMSGGLRKHVVQLIKHLNQEQFEIYFIHGTKTYDQAFIDEYDLIRNYATIIPCKHFNREINFKHDWNTYQFVLNRMKIIAPDIVHCHSSKAGVIGRLAAKRIGIKKVFYTPHAYSFLSPEFSSSKKFFFISIERLLSKYATTKTFNVSKGEKKAALDMKIDRSQKFEVIYNGLPETELPSKNDAKKALGFSENTMIIGTNARLSNQKNPMLFLEIAKRVIYQNNSIHFVWAGNGPLFDCAQNFISKNKLNDNIHLLGDRKDSEIIVVGYDIFLSTALYEGLPYAPIEAIRAGVPLFLSNVTGNDELVNSNDSGILFELDSTEKVVNILNEFICGRYFFEKEKILKTFRETFSENIMISKIEKNYIGE